MAAQEGGRREIRCPATGELVAEIDESTAVDTESAIAAARAAFDTGPWAATSARERGDVLLRVADLLQRDKAEMARMESLDTGKRLVESEIDIDDVTSVFHHFGLVADAEAGRVVDTGRDDVVSRVVHEPVGVCGLITPWNYPLLQVSWKVAPALAAGCTFVLKPSELSPHTAIHLMKLLAEAGVPAGRRQPGGRRRPERRCPAERGPARGPGLLHRRARDRQADHGRRVGHREEDRARARWQEPQHRLRRRRPRERARHGADRGVPALRPGLLRRGTADRRGVDPRLVRAGAGRPRRGDPPRWSLRREGTDRCADLAGPPGQGDGVRRGRGGRGRHGAARRTPGHRG